MPRIVRSRWFQLAFVAAVSALVAIPASVWASHQFVDVPDSNPFHDDIDAIAQVGVTKGCFTEPPRYCPDDFVTREQMAAFLNRLGALSADQEPVVNAAELGGREAREFAWTEGVPLQFFSRIEIFQVENPENNEEECQPSQSDFELGENTPVYTVQYTVFDVPDAADFGPWDVNVAVAFVDEGAYQVCFATIDGRPLPAGTYRVFRLEAVPIGVS
ncbi:MAG: hypothetical protein M3N51_06805 [Actinomycetota bacterium]|nr:hypothetical protein [Actinomycetota bacterium]